MIGANYYLEYAGQSLFLNMDTYFHVTQLEFVCMFVL